MWDFSCPRVAPVQAFVLVVLIWVGGAVLVGMSTFNDYPAPERQTTAFLDALSTNPKVGAYYLRTDALDRLGYCIKVVAQTDSAALTRFYTTENGLHQTPSCQPEMEISLDRHAVGTILAASFDAKGTLLSEFLTGHIKVSGIGLTELLGVWVWR